MAITYFGNTNDSAGITNPGSQQHPRRSVRGTRTGNITAARAKIQGGASNSSTKIHIYAVSAGAPGAWLGSSDQLVIAASSALAVRDFTFSYPGRGRVRHQLLPDGPRQRLRHSASATRPPAPTTSKPAPTRPPPTHTAPPAGLSRASVSTSRPASTARGTQRSSPASWRPTDAQRQRPPSRRRRLGQADAATPRLLGQRRQQHPDPQLQSLRVLVPRRSPPPIVARPAMAKLCRVFLEPMRAKFGACYVLAGYRHELYNARIGGARHSQHIYEDNFECVAADLRFQRGTPAQWAAYAKGLRGEDGRQGRGRPLRPLRLRARRQPHLRRRPGQADGLGRRSPSQHPPRSCSGVIVGYIIRGRYSLEKTSKSSASKSRGHG